MKYHNRWYTVLDPDLQVGEGGRGEGSGGHSDPEKMGGEVSKKFFFNFFPTLGLQFGLKIRGGGGWGGPPLDLPGTFLAIDPTQTIFHVCK